MIGTGLMLDAIAALAEGLDVGDPVCAAGTQWFHMVDGERKGLGAGKTRVTKVAAQSHPVLITKVTFGTNRTGTPVRLYDHRTFLGLCSRAN